MSAVLNKPKKTPKLIGDGYDLLTMDIPPVQWFVPNVIAKYQQTLFAGDSGSGKSTWLLYNALCIATGTDTIMGSTKQANVLFIDEEMGKKGLAMKVQQICKPLGVKPSQLKGFFWRTSKGFKFDNEHAKDMIISYKTKHNVDVIIVDSLIATSKGDPNTMDVRKLRDFLRIGYVYDISIIFNHHTNKAGTGKGRVDSKAMYGSIDITNAFDNTYGISRFDNDKIKLEHIKARYLAPEDRININIPTKDMTYSKPYQTSGYQYVEAILNLFKTSGETQLRFKDFKTALVRKNPKIENGYMSEFSLQKYLKECQKQKLLCKNEGGFYEIL